MHNFVVRGLSFVGATAMFSVVCMAPCAEDIQPLATAATSDYIQSGLYTGELLREVNSIIEAKYPVITGFLSQSVGIMQK